MFTNMFNITKYIMIPILEVHGYIALLLAMIIVTIRIYCCCKLYNSNFIIEILQMALLTSFMWLLYCIRKANKPLACQFIVSMIMYVIAILYLSNQRKH